MKRGAGLRLACQPEMLEAIVDAEEEPVAVRYVAWVLAHPETVDEDGNGVLDDPMELLSVDEKEDAMDRLEELGAVTWESGS